MRTGPTNKKIPVIGSESDQLESVLHSSSSFAGRRKYGGHGGMFSEKSRSYFSAPLAVQMQHAALERPVQKGDFAVILICLYAVFILIVACTLQ